jgi:hypothetical protein
MRWRSKQKGRWSPIGALHWRRSNSGFRTPQLLQNGLFDLLGKAGVKLHYHGPKGSQEMEGDVGVEHVELERSSSAPASTWNEKKPWVLH